MFKFNMKRQKTWADRTNVDWYEAVDVSVLAENQTEAISKAQTVSGLLSSNFRWAFRVDSIEEVIMPSDTVYNVFVQNVPAPDPLGDDIRA